jgi:hypothetical protein
MRSGRCYSLRQVRWADVVNITKKLHNALQRNTLHLSADEIRLFEPIAFENALCQHLEGRDVIIVHDPQLDKFLYWLHVVA